MRNPPSGNEWIAHLPNAGLEGCFLLELGLLAFESFRFLMRWNHFGLKRINCLSQTRANKFGDGKGCIENTRTLHLYSEQKERPLVTYCPIGIRLLGLTNNNSQILEL